MSFKASEIRSGIRLGRRGFFTSIALALASGIVTTSARALTMVKGTVIGLNGWLFLVWDDPRSAKLSRIPAVAATIKTASDSLRRAGILPIVLLIPSKARVYREFLPQDFSFSPDAEKRYETALKLFREGGNFVPDLGGCLNGLRASQPSIPLWFKVDTHWTPSAAEACAAYVAKEMMARPDFPKANGTGAVLGPAVTETHFKSDLASVLPPEMRGQYPNEDYVVRREVFTAKKTALTDDPQGDIVIVGSSYLQPKYNFAPALSSELKQSVQLHWRIHNVGPYRTLLEYVGGGAFKKKKPKVLIWCFLENDVEAMLDDKSVWFDMAIGGDEFLQQLTKSVTV